MRTRTQNLLLGVLAGLLATGAATESPACADFRIQAADGTVIIGRTMDFEVPVLSAVRIFPRGERLCSEAPGTSGGSAGPRITGGGGPALHPWFSYS
jgi:penicillin V acylase-like amidase (Ntn superfamily)